MTPKQLQKILRKQHLEADRSFLQNLGLADLSREERFAALAIMQATPAGHDYTGFRQWCECLSLAILILTGLFLLSFHT